MMNPLFGKFQNGQNYPQSQPNLLQQFNEFASQFRGNPKDKVDELLATGRHITKFDVVSVENEISCV